VSRASDVAPPAPEACRIRGSVRMCDDMSPNDPADEAVELLLILLYGAAADGCSPAAAGSRRIRVR